MTDTGSTAHKWPGSRSLAATICAWVLVISLGAAGTAAFPGPGPGPAAPQEAHAKTGDQAPQAGDKTSPGAEPSTWLLLAAGLAALLLLHQRRRPRPQMA